MQADKRTRSKHARRFANRGSEMTSATTTRSRAGVEGPGGGGPRSRVSLDADRGDFQIFDDEADGLKIVAQVGFDQQFLDMFRLVRLEESSVCSHAMQR